MTDGTEPVDQDGYLLQTSTITGVVDNVLNSLDMIDGLSQVPKEMIIRSLTF